MGFVAGLRSMTAPAAALAGTESPFAGPALLLAAAELVADKLPATPSRLQPAAFGARVLSGAYCGLALAQRFAGNAACGVPCGALGAIAGTFAGSAWRTKIGPALKAPDFALALAEDATAIGLALLLTRA